jgi:hypothetical protein
MILERGRGSQFFLVWQWGEGKVDCKPKCELPLIKNGCVSGAFNG